MSMGFKKALQLSSIVFTVFCMVVAGLWFQPEVTVRALEAGEAGELKTYTREQWEQIIFGTETLKRDSYQYVSGSDENDNPIWKTAKWKYSMELKSKDRKTVGLGFTTDKLAYTDGSKATINYYVIYNKVNRSLELYYVASDVEDGSQDWNNWRSDTFKLIEETPGGIAFADIFEGEGISLIGNVSGGSSDTTEDTQVETKLGKVEGTKAVNKEGNKLYITWKTVTDADGYQIIYATDSKFTKNKKAVSVGASVYKKTVSKLAKNKTYYVKVRAYKLDDAGKKIYGSYSTVRKIKITK